MPDNTRKPIQIDPRLLCRPHARMEGIQFRDKMEVDVLAIEGILSGLRGLPTARLCQHEHKRLTWGIARLTAP